MYGVVLLMAVTAGGETADFGRRGGCHGCYGGCYGCYGGGCYGGGYGGCYGGGYGGCYGGGCYGGGYSYGCYGGGCYGGGYGGCYGGGYGGCYGGGYSYGCYGGGYGGCYGGYAVSYGGGCYGGYAVSYGCCGGNGGKPSNGGKPTDNGKPTDEGKKIEDKGKGKKKTDDIDDLVRATIEVTLPASAQLTIDGAATRSTSPLRRFKSPALQPGKAYYYTLEASYQNDGKPITVSKKVTIEAGKLSRVDLNQPATAVASK